MNRPKARRCRPRPASSLGKLRLGLALLAFSAAGVPGGDRGRCRAGDWPQWRGPTRDGVSAEAVWPATWPEDGPEVLWEARVGIGFSSIAVARGRAYTMGHVEGEDIVWCLSAEGGKEIWRYSHPAELGDDLHEGGPAATPTVDRDRVFTINKQGLVLSLDARDGALIWKRDLKGEEGVRPNDWGLSGSPLVWKDLVVLNAGTNGLALGREDGKTVWKNGTEKAGYASPVVFRPGGGVPPSILIFAAAELVAVAPETGAVRWRYAWRTGYQNNNADPLIAGKQVLITSYDRGAALLEVEGDGVTARYDKRAHAINTHMAPPVLSGEHLFGFSNHYARRPQLRCVHLPTGEIRWREDRLAAGSVMLAGGTLVILGGRGELILARPSDKSFEPLARAKVLSGRCWTPPALAGGRLWVRSSQGVLRCLELGTRTAESRPRPR